MFVSQIAAVSFIYSSSIILLLHARRVSQSPSPVPPPSHPVIIPSLTTVPLIGQNICIWWRHEMEKFSALLTICVGNWLVPGEFPAQRPVTRRFDVFFDRRLNKRLSKQSWGWWFETPSRPLLHHRNEAHTQQYFMLHGSCIILFCGLEFCFDVNLSCRLFLQLSWEACQFSSNCQLIRTDIEKAVQTGLKILWLRKANGRLSDNCISYVYDGNVLFEAFSHLQAPWYDEFMCLCYHKT